MCVYYCKRSQVPVTFVFKHRWCSKKLVQDKPLTVGSSN